MEIRAYERLPFAITSAMLSDFSGSTNSSLVEALSLSLFYPNGESFWNDRVAESANGVWQVNFGYNK
jgi:hypothetical protein